MTNCEKKLLRELQDLLGTKTVKTTTNNDYDKGRVYEYSLYFKAYSILK